MNITRVGFGSWAVGGDWAVGWGSQDDNASVAAIRHAVSCGINWIDTAAIYGLGHSERDCRGCDASYFRKASALMFFTKCGLIATQTIRKWDRARSSAASIRREVEASLRRLKVERI